MFSMVNTKALYPQRSYSAAFPRGCENFSKCQIPRKSVEKQKICKSVIRLWGLGFNQHRDVMTMLLFQEIQLTCVSFRCLQEIILLFCYKLDSKQSTHTKQGQEALAGAWGMEGRSHHYLVCPACYTTML